MNEAGTTFLLPENWQEIQFFVESDKVPSRPATPMNVRPIVSPYPECNTKFFTKIYCTSHNLSVLMITVFSSFTTASSLEIHRKMDVLFCWFSWKVDCGVCPSTLLRYISSWDAPSAPSRKCYEDLSCKGRGSTKRGERVWRYRRWYKWKVRLYSSSQQGDHCSGNLLLVLLFKDNYFRRRHDWSWPKNPRFSFWRDLAIWVLDASN